MTDRWWKCYCGEVVTEPHRDCDGGVPWDRENDRRVSCRTCWDTGQVWAPEADGTGMYDSACPDGDAPYPLSQAVRQAKLLPYREREEAPGAHPDH